MARRPNAGPRIPVQQRLTLPPLTDEARQWLTDSLDIDREVADRVMLRDGHDLWTGFRRAFFDVLDRLSAAHAGPAARAVSAEIGDFAAEHLAPLVKAHAALSPATRQLLAANAPDFVEALPDAANGIPVLADMIEQLSDPRRMAVILFLGDIIALVDNAAVRISLPPKSDRGQSAAAYQLFEVTRASIEIACELARCHAPAALPELERLHRSADATLLDKLYAARSTYTPFRLACSD